MKKLMMTMACAAAMAAMAQEPAAPAPAPAAAPAATTAPAKKDFVWRWWARDADYNNLDVRGCELALASAAKSVSGAQVNLLWGKAKAVKSGAQVSFGYSRTDTLRNGCQMAVVNSADQAALQFGLLCFNKKGFLPFFPFFNFSKGAFGEAK